MPNDFGFSLHLFKRSLQTQDAFSRISLNPTGNLSSSPKRAAK
jgi:hypothetical protein